MKKTNLVLFLICAVIWGITWIAIKYQIDSVDSSVAVFYRFIFSSLVMFAAAALTKTKLKYNQQDHFRFFLQGLFLFCLNYIITYWATGLATSALIALAFTSLIFFNMFGGRLFLKIPFERKVVIGALISFAGMGFISYNEYLHLDGLQNHPHSLWGFLLSVLATLSASAGNLFSAKNRQLKIPISANNAWSMLYGSICTASFCFIQQKPFAIHWSTSFVISFLYLSIFGTVISFWAYIKLIENIGPAKSAFTSIASPVIAMTVSTFFEDLNWTYFLIIGAALCIIGNVTALFPTTIESSEKQR